MPADPQTFSGDERLDILVVGSSELALETCRLGRAAGHRLTNLSRAGRPRDDAPWLDGVEWRDLSNPRADRLREVAERRDAIVAFSSSDVFAPLLDALTASAPPEFAGRLVRVLQTHPDASNEVPDAVTLRLPELEPLESSGSYVPSSEGRKMIPTAQAAMAILRTAIEGQHRGTLDPEEVAELGRAVMIQ